MYPRNEQERLEQFFWELESKIPNPPSDWAKAAKPCKYKRILEERKAATVKELDSYQS